MRLQQYRRNLKRFSSGFAALCVVFLLAGVCVLTTGCASDSSSDSEGEMTEADQGEQNPSEDLDDLGEQEPSKDLDDLGDEVPPEGLEPDGVALAARLDTYLEASFPQTGVPGVAVAVVDSEGVRYLRTFGDCPSDTSPFLVGSLSKSFTALAVMQLVENGRIDLDASAAWYAPAYATPLEVTVRDLLNQTSGFGYYDSLAKAQVGDTFGSFSYANANYDLLGRIVEAVSGQSYADYLSDHVLALLGMSTSSADYAEAQDRGMAPGHRTWFGVPVADGFVHADNDDAWGSAPSGYVASSVSDMATYLQMYLNAGKGSNGVSILSPEGISSMFLNRVPDPSGDTFYGMGWTSFYWDDGELVLSHDGQVENYVASMCLLPERDLGIVVLGDASDSVGGDTLFFEMVNGVVATSVGADSAPVDGLWWVKAAHQRNDVLYACALIACSLPLLLLSAWRNRLGEISRSMCGAVRARSRRIMIVRAVVLHVVIPVGILVLPFVIGIPWRDILTFAPDVSLVLLGCAVLLLLGGISKLILYRMSHNAQH